jgi:hypothetical protein
MSPHRFTSLSVLSCALVTLSAARPKATSDDVTTILGERLDVLRQVEGLQVEAYRRGEAPFDSVLAVQKEVIEASLELTDQKEERVRLLERLLNTMTEFERMAQQRHQAGLAVFVDVLKAKAARLKAQAELIRERER